MASVRPVQSTPIPMMPRQVPSGMGIPNTGFGPVFSVGHLQRAGVVVQKIVTTTGRHCGPCKGDDYSKSSILKIGGAWGEVLPSTTANQ